MTSVGVGIGLLRAHLKRVSIDDEDIADLST